MNDTLERDRRLAAEVTPLASPAFSAPAHPVAPATDSDDPGPGEDESGAVRAERPSPIPHVPPQG